MFLQHLFCLGAFVLPNDRFGTVTVARLLNNEKVSQYSLIIMAKDGGDVTGGMSLNSKDGGDVTGGMSLNSTVCALDTMYQ